MSSINVSYLADENADAKKTEFETATDNWVELSSGTPIKNATGVVTGTKSNFISELLNFVKSLGGLAKNIGDVLSVVNKYI